MWFQLILVAVLVVLNAAFAGTEMAMVSLREGQLQRLSEKGATGALVVRLSQNPTNFLATIQVGITLAGFLASASAAVSLAAPLEERLDMLGGAAGPASVIIVTLILAYFTLVFGELAPKRIAMQRAEKWAMMMARPLQGLSTLARPAVWLLARSTDLAVRLLGADPHMQREEITDDELREMVLVHETLSPDQRRVIDGAFSISQRQLGQVLVPRGDVFVLDAASPVAEALEELRASGHSRAPVAPDRSLDRVVGVVHLRDLVAPDGTAAASAGDEGQLVALSTDPVVFPEAARVLTALRDLQHRRTQLAVIVDEHGGAVGIVTVEDLVEELVGEIYDETDDVEHEVVSESDGTVVLPGRYPVHELPTIGVELPDGDYVTIAGLVLDELGRFPSAGERLVVAGRVIEVRSTEDHTVTAVAVLPEPQVDDPDLAADHDAASTR